MRIQPPIAGYRKLDIWNFRKSTIPLAAKDGELRAVFTDRRVEPGWTELESPSLTPA